MSKFSAKQQAFIRWLALGKYHKEPSTQGELAEQLGVRQETLSRWKKGNHSFTQEDFDIAVQAEIDRVNKEEIPNAFSALRDRVRKGEFQHLKLFFEMMGLYVEKRQIEGGDNPLLIIDGRD